MLGGGGGGDGGLCGWVGVGRTVAVTSKEKPQQKKERNHSSHRHRACPQAAPPPLRCVRNGRAPHADEPLLAVFPEDSRASHAASLQLPHLMLSRRDAPASVCRSDRASPCRLHVSDTPALYTAAGRGKAKTCLLFLGGSWQSDASFLFSVSWAGGGGRQKKVYLEGG
jgi:hypothetical protein